MGRFDDLNFKYPLINDNGMEYIEHHHELFTRHGLCTSRMPLDSGLEENVTSTFMKANYLVTIETLYCYDIHMATILFHSQTNLVRLLLPSLI